MVEDFPQYADVPFAHHVLMMDETGTWSGQDGRALLADPEIMVAVIPRRQLVQEIEGEFTYVGSCHWKGEIFVVLRVPNPVTQTWIALQFETIPFGSLPRIHLPEVRDVA